jgi:hypothetical protein
VISQSQNIDLNSMSFVCSLIVDMNATMRRIDLFCKLAGPLFVSLLTIRSSSFAALFLTGTNLVSFPFEYCFILIVHKRFPALAIKPPRSAQTSPPFIRQIIQWPLMTFSSWKIYYRSPLFSASLSLSILYFTVLSFGGSLRCLTPNSRLDDCVSLPIFGLFNPPNRRTPSYRRHRRNNRNLPLCTRNPSNRSGKSRNMVFIMANNFPFSCCRYNVPFSK